MNQVLKMLGASGSIGFAYEPLLHVLRPADDIRRKEIPRWPNRRSYAAHKRKGGGR